MSLDTCSFCPWKVHTRRGPGRESHWMTLLWHPGLAKPPRTAVVLRSRHVQSISFLLYRDTFIVTLGNAITSILAGFAIFSVLGYMSQELGVPVNQVAKAGETKQGCGKHLRVSE